MKWSDAAVLMAICMLFAALVLNLSPKRTASEAEMRRVAVEEACRTIVEAKLVRSCTLRNSLQNKQ